MNRERTINLQNMNLVNEFRKLWEQHVMWTRSLIISIASDLPDLAPVTARLLRNPKDFAKVLKHFYGVQNATEFDKLLTAHLLFAAALVNAAKAGDSAGVEKARKDWYANADDIAKFLFSINPLWNEEKWRAYLYEHLRMTEEEAVLRLTKQYEANVAIYDKIEEQALKMGDFMASGIRMQFDS